MKKYRKIEHLHEEDIEIGGLIRKCNTQNFAPGVPITIQEKIDGSCASIEIDFDKNEYKICSHHKELKGEDGLNGFKKYAEPIAKRIMKDQIDTYKRIYGKSLIGSIAIFGEWTGKPNRLAYNEESKGKWYVFDYFSNFDNRYAPQYIVENFCSKYDLDYIKPYYEGLFKSWEHCKSFLNKPQYGEKQEGVVVKINDYADIEWKKGAARYIKIVNDDYRETKRIKLPKNISPDVKIAKDLADSVVTEARVIKKLNDLAADGILPQNEITPQDMQIIVKHLPKIIHEDIKEEEPEIFEKMGKLAGKMINRKTIEIVKKLVLQ